MHGFAYSLCVQPLNVVENVEFCDLLTYISDHVTDDDVPHRTKMRNLVMRLYHEVHDENLRKFREACLLPPHPFSR
jgi:hypothetical protein